MRKYSIINALVRTRGYASYLEVCTPVTGNQFAAIDESALRARQRLMYRCPPDFTDGSEITFRSTDETIEGLATECAYDVIFLDSWHTYECATRDLRFGLSRLAPGGTLVVHDCLPPRSEEAGPLPPVPWGPWCGVSYCAYVDFIWSEPGIVFYTIDSDFGCGVIRRAPDGMDGRAPKRDVVQQWNARRARAGYEVFDFYVDHRRELANVISVDEFLALENIDGSALRPGLAYALQRAGADLRWVASTPYRRAQMRRLQEERWLAPNLEPRFTVEPLQERAS
jgi:hypothetical protein